MQEYGREQASAFVNGIEPDRRTPRDAPYLIYAKNLKPSPYGLISPEPFTDPTASTVSSWPFPMLKRGGRSYLKLGSTTLDAGTTAGFASLGSVTTYNSTTPASTLSITAGSSWQTAFFHDAWFATNGASFLFKLPSNASSKTYCNTTITVKTITRYRNQIALGGVSLGSWGSSPRFLKAVQMWKDNLAGHEYSTTAMTPDSTWAFWSRRGGDFNDVPFRPMMALMGFLGDAAFDADWPIIERGLKERSLGFWPVQQPGDILAMAEMGDDLVAFGANGLLRMQPTEAGFMQSPERPYGIYGRGCCAGWERELVFIGSGGDLYKWVLGSGIQKLGFRDQLRSLSAANTVISYDPYEGDYTITDGTLCYILNAWDKLGGPMGLMPTSLVREGTSLYSCYKGTATQVEFHMKEMSWGNRDSKSIPVIQMEYEGVTSPEVSIGWREDVGVAYVNAPWTPCNKEGVGFPQCSFVDGKIRFRATIDTDPSVDVRIGGGEIRYQQEGRRFVRGISGAEARK